MTKRSLSLLAPFFLSLTLVAAFAQQQPASSSANSVGVIVTAEASRGKAIPSLEPDDIRVTQNGKPVQVTALTPFQGESAPLQLLLLIDDSAGSSFGTEINTLKHFITSLPSGVDVGVGYMRNGMSQMTSSFTRDHAAAAKSVRLAQGPGGADVSPYDSLSDAIKRWPGGQTRREVIMISSGIEGLGGGFTSDNPYVNAGIASAQKAGVVVYTIYSPSVGHAGHTFWRENWGQNFLSMLSDATGGESYFIGFGSPVSFAPFLQEIRENLDHQYMLTFQAIPQGKAGLQPIKIKVKEKNASLAFPTRVYIGAR
jgi:VWFA-related protein